jgi:hypothetical protein
MARPLSAARRLAVEREPRVTAAEAYQSERVNAFAKEIGLTAALHRSPERTTTTLWVAIPTTLVNVGLALERCS